MECLIHSFTAITKRKGIYFYISLLISMPRLLVTMMKYKKLAEFLSFAFWEILHALHFFKPGDYVTFKNPLPITKISDHELVDLSRKSQLLVHFHQNQVSATELALKWLDVFVDKNEILWGYIASEPNVLYRSKDKGSRAKKLFSFSSRLTSIHVDNRNSIFVCCGGTIFKSKDYGVSFYPVLQFSSPNSLFLSGCGFAEDDLGRLFVAEYYTDSLTLPGAWLYWSEDYGDNWHRTDFLIRQGASQHAHVVKYFRKARKLCLSDGDNKKRLWINDTMTNFSSSSSKKDPSGWRLINKSHIQMGGYLSAEDLGDQMIFGTDYLGGTNFFVKTRNGTEFQRFLIPDPYRRNPVLKIILTKSTSGREVWACLRNWIRSRHSKGAILLSSDNGETWSKFIEYDGIKSDIDIISSSCSVLGYLFIMISRRGEYDGSVFRIDR